MRDLLRRECNSQYLKLVVHFTIVFCLIFNPLVVHGQSQGEPSQEEIQRTIEIRQIDTWSLLTQSIFQHKSAGSMSLKNVGLIVSENQPNDPNDWDIENAQIFPGRTFSQSDSNPNIFHDAQIQNEDQFISLSYKGKVFWTFDRPVKSAVRYGDYLIFLEQGADKNPSETKLSFIDLSYFQSALGHKEGWLSVFKFPLHLEEPLKSLKIEEGLLKINDLELSTETLNHIGFDQAITWNVQANLLDERTHTDLSPIADDVIDAFDRSQELASEKVLAQIHAAGVTEEKRQAIRGDLVSRIQRAREKISQTSDNKKEDTALEETKSLIEEMALEKESQVEEQMKRSSKLHANGRKLLGRIGLMWERLSLPRPMGGSSIRQALAFVLGSLKGPKGERAWKLKEGFLQILHNPKVNWGVPFVSALLLGTFYPEVAQGYVYQILDLGGSVSDKLWQTHKDFWNLSKDAFTANGMLNPKRLWEAYGGEETLGRFLTANRVLITKILQVFGISHLAINSVQLIRDLKKRGQNTQATELGGIYKEARGNEDSWLSAMLKAVRHARPSQGWELVKAIKNDFIARQNTERLAYLKAQSQTVGVQENIEFTREESAEAARQVHAQIEKERTLFGRFFDKIKNSVTNSSRNKKTDVEIKNTWQAFTNFVFSWNALEDTYKVLTPIWWKYIFLGRSFTPWRAPTGLGLLYYPGAFRVGTLNGVHKPGVLISDANGGKRPFWRHAPLLLKNMFGQGKYKIYREWEDRIIPIETLILEEAQRRALKRTLQRMRNSEELKDIYRSENREQILKRLNKENMEYYNRSVDELVRRSFLEFITPVLQANACNDIESCLAQIDDYKEVTLDTLNAIRFSESDAKKLLDSVESEELYQAAQEYKVDPNSSWLVRKMNAAIRKNFSDPRKNNQIMRWLVVEEQLRDPGARARSTRKAFYGFLEKIPELFITWAAVAGIMISALNGTTAPGDMMVPLTDKFPYYSSYLFSAGFFSGVVISMLANFGMNLQIEYRLKNTGLFDKIPEGEDAKKGFFRWFWKQFWDKENTWFKNHKDILTIVWANIPASTTMYIAIYGLTLGRFPLDVYLMGYLMYFVMPISGFNMKIDQAFEAAAAGYWAKYFPNEKLRKHPMVQEYFLKKKGKARAVFQFIFTFIYSNIVGAFLSNLQMMASDTSRKLSRLLFFGHPPTVWVVNALESIKNAISAIPGAETVLTTCQKALSNNYDAWDPTIDGEVPEWIEKPWQKPGSK